MRGRSCHHARGDDTRATRTGTHQNPRPPSSSTTAARTVQDHEQGGNRPQHHSPGFPGVPPRRFHPSRLPGRKAESRSRTRAQKIIREPIRVFDNFRADLKHPRLPLPIHNFSGKLTALFGKHDPHVPKHNRRNRDLLRRGSSQPGCTSALAFVPYNEMSLNLFLKEKG